MNQPTNKSEEELAVHKAHCFRVVQPENEFMGCKYGPDEDCLVYVPPNTTHLDAELDTIFEKMNGSGAHACYCPRSVDGGCQCAIKDEYAEEAKAALRQLIRDEVRAKQQHEREFLERLKLEFDANVSQEAGEHWSESDAAQMVNKHLEELNCE